jgi:hypothetical protein
MPNLDDYKIFTSYKEAGLKEPNKKDLESRRKVSAPAIRKVVAVVDGVRVTKYQRKVKDGKFEYRPGIHMGKNGLEDFDGSWLEVGAEYK